MCKTPKKQCATLTPELFDNEKIMYNSALSKELGQLYVDKIRDWYVRRFRSYKKSRMCGKFSVEVKGNRKKVILLTYEAEENLHTVFNRAIRLELLC